MNTEMTTPNYICGFQTVMASIDALVLLTYKYVNPSVHVCRREDAGLLVYKDHLPVSQVVVGDMSRSGSEAKLTVGPLTCQGDRECLSLHTHSSVFNDISTFYPYPVVVF